MADNSQTDAPIMSSVEPPVSSTTADAFSTTASYVSDRRSSAAVALNATASKKINGPVQLPTLVESDEAGFKGSKNHPFLVRCCRIGPHLLEKNTAYDFILMASVAATQGVSLRISSGFRTMAEQERLYAAREKLSPEAKAKSGRVATPGTSNHQQGIAIDFEMTVGVVEYKAGSARTDKSYRWLEDNAAAFGFDHVEGNKVNEPWHWTHLEQVVSGSAAFVAATGSEIMSLDTAVAVSNVYNSGTQRTIFLGVHDLTVGISRSNAMPNVSRAASYQGMALCDANQSNAISCAVSTAQATTLEETPTPFDAETLAPFSYNFETGYWEDDKPV